MLKSEANILPGQLLLEIQMPHRTVLQLVSYDIVSSKKIKFNNKQQEPFNQMYLECTYKHRFISSNHHITLNLLSAHEPPKFKNFSCTQPANSCKINVSITSIVFDFCAGIVIWSVSGTLNWRTENVAYHYDGYLQSTEFFFHSALCHQVYQLHFSCQNA